MSKHILYLVILVFVVSNSFAQLKWDEVIISGKKDLTLSISVSPRNTVYATSYFSHKLYRSFDEGSTWDSIETPFQAHISAIDSIGNLYRMYEDTLFVSTDDGISWSNHKIPYRFTQHILVSKDTLFLFTYGPSVYTSVNRGSSWTLKGTYFYGSDFNWAGWQIAPNGNLFGFQSTNNSTELISGTGPRSILTSFGFIALDNDPVSWMIFDNAGYGYGEHGFLIRSSDNGITWVPIDSSETNAAKGYWGPFGILKTNDLIRITNAQTEISSDHANTWQKIGEAIPVTWNRWYITSAKGTLFYTCDSGTYRSTFFTSIPKTARAENNFNARYDRLRDVIVASKTIGLINSDNISLFDMTGRSVRINHTNLSENKVEIDAQGLQTGVYLIRYVTSSEEYSAKILIVK